MANIYFDKQSHAAAPDAASFRNGKRTLDVLQTNIKLMMYIFFVFGQFQQRIRICMKSRHMSLPAVNMDTYQHFGFISE